MLGSSLLVSFTGDRLVDVLTTRGQLLRPQLTVELEVVRRRRQRRSRHGVVVTAARLVVVMLMMCAERRRIMVDDGRQPGGRRLLMMLGLLMTKMKRGWCGWWVGHHRRFWVGDGEPAMKWAGTDRRWSTNTVAQSVYANTTFTVHVA